MGCVWGGGWDSLSLVPPLSSGGQGTGLSFIVLLRRRSKVVDLTQGWVDSSDGVSLGLSDPMVGWLSPCPQMPLGGQSAGLSALLTPWSLRIRQSGWVVVKLCPQSFAPLACRAHHRKYRGRRGTGTAGVYSGQVRERPALTEPLASPVPLARSPSF